MRDKAFRLGVLNGTIFEVVIIVMQPSLVLSAFFLKLTDSTFLAALPAALMHLGGLWPQLIVAHIAEGMEYKKPIYVWAGAVRVVTLLAMAVVTYQMIGVDTSALVLFFAAVYFVYSSANGAGGIGFMDMVAKTIPATRRGRFMGLRGFYGGLMGLATGFYVRYMLGESGPVFPLNSALLFFTATAFLLVAVSVYAAVPEPAGRIVEQRTPFRQLFRRGWVTLREDRNYRLLVSVRMLLSATMVGQVVFVPYALKALLLPESIIGVLMISATCFTLPSNFLWGHIGDRYGNRLLLLTGAIFFLAAPICALASWYAPAYHLLFFLPETYDLRALLFVAAFILAGVGMRGSFMGSSNYFLEIAPEDRRPSYQAFMRVLQAPATLGPLLGGSIAEHISFQATFLLACIGGLCTCILVWRLGEPRRERI
jgi:hypothetical protein